MYEVKHEYPEFFQRINRKDSIYYAIVYKTFINNLNKIENSDFNDLTKLEQLSKSFFNEFHIIIVFSVMALETFINDYLAVCLTDDFYYQNLDRLNLLQKIEITFSLIWSDPIDKSKKLYKYLKDIIKERNHFVHTKSQQFDFKKLEETNNFTSLSDIDLEDEASQYISSLQEELIAFLQDSFYSLKGLYLFFKTVDEHDNNRHAVTNTMSCMIGNDFFYDEQIASAIEENFKDIEIRINNIKKQKSI